MWFALNIQKDKLEYSEQLKILCQHIRPEAYFKDKPTAISTDFFKDIEEKLGRSLSEEEKGLMGGPTPDFNNFDDIDIIERA